MLPAADGSMPSLPIGSPNCLVVAVLKGCVKKYLGQRCRAE